MVSCMKDPQLILLPMSDTSWMPHTLNIGLDVVHPWLGLHSHRISIHYFFFWGHRKFFIYQSLVDSAEDLVAKIIVAADKFSAAQGIFERERQSLFCCCELCNTTLGSHFEQLLWVFFMLINVFVQRFFDFSQFAIQFCHLTLQISAIQSAIRL